MNAIKRWLKQVPGLVPLVRHGRQWHRARRTRQLLRRHPDGGYLKCGNVEVFCDFRDPTYAWYDGLSQSLAMDQEIIRTILRQPVAQGNVLIDIGAHCGFFTAYLAFLSQMLSIPGAKVIALEPDRRHFACLQKTIQRSPLPAVKVINAAIAEKDGVVDLYGTQDDCLHSYFTEGASPLYTVPAITLDTLGEEHLTSEERIAFIKIDVDGAEPDLFRGGQRTIEKHRPVILMEFAPDWLRRAGVDTKGLFCQLCDEYEVYFVSYVPRSIRKVRHADYDEIMAIVGGAISDFILSKTPLDLSGI